MKKHWKWILAIIAAGTAAGLLIAHFVKKNQETDELDEFAEDDFDLDVDLQPVSSEREYVSLKKAASETTVENEETTETDDEAEETLETAQNVESSEADEPVEEKEEAAKTEA